MFRQLITAQTWPTIWMVGTTLMCGVVGVAWMTRRSARRRLAELKQVQEHDERIRAEVVRNRLNSIHEAEEKQPVEVIVLGTKQDREFLQSAGIAE